MLLRPLHSLFSWQPWGVFVVWGRLSCSRSFNTVGGNTLTWSGRLDYLQLLLHSTTPPLHTTTLPLHSTPPLYPPPLHPPPLHTTLPTPSTPLYPPPPHHSTPPTPLYPSTPHHHSTPPLHTTTLPLHSTPPLYPSTPHHHSTTQFSTPFDPSTPLRTRPALHYLLTCQRNILVWFISYLVQRSGTCQSEEA
ncbi:hypothetical protein Pcinc_037179 [Petrolisthes cinctipes]|uniref:Uncharacterized protein n=1 Tax=Petrolisthes cinctipes TaxID=88211 RepID=A0AAE1BU31_PETCI|nr:hypothetical protein Pcinc_037179 [Petrolisthes cinctipes]